MRDRFVALLVLLIATIASMAPANAGQLAAGAQRRLADVSYVCPMVGDEEVVEDKPGVCPKCRMVLAPVRLEPKFVCPIHSLVVVRDGPGKCPLDERDLVPVTLSVFWTCPPDDKHLLEPGPCANGQRPAIGHEQRAHSDHNPRHGGQFFMAQDGWHHVEGTLQRGDVFRMFFYDNFTKPIAVTAFEGRMVLKEEWDPVTRRTRELQAVQLKPGRDGRTFEARATPAALPLNAAVIVRFDAKGPEQRFDFSFTDYSREPVAPPVATVRAKPTSAARTQPVPAPTPPAPPGPDAAVQSALAAALDESALPGSLPGLLAELAKRARSVENIVNDGSLSDVWLPAMATKAAALALDSYTTGLPEQQRSEATAAIKRVVTSAWELEAWGDLGNKQKASDAYRLLAAGVSDAQAIYAGAR